MERDPDITPDIYWRPLESVKTIGRFVTDRLFSDVPAQPVVEYQERYEQLRLDS